MKLWRQARDRRFSVMMLIRLQSLSTKWMRGRAPGFDLPGRKEAALSTSPTNPPDNKQPRDATYWAQQTAIFKVSQLSSGALDLNVEGRRGLSPLQGFGQMWQKIFRVRLKDREVSPTEVIRAWKENFPKFWPKGSRFHTPLTGIAPGEVAILRLVPGGMPLSTGVMVLYADDESF